MAEQAETENVTNETADTEADVKSVEATEPKPAEVPQRTAPEVPAGKHYFWGTGRRKKAIARVRIRPGKGNILINKRDMEEYFKADRDRNAVLAPLETVSMLKAWDIWANVQGGGATGQADAVKLGLARAISLAMPDIERTLRGQNLMTRDPRMKERKKPGQKGARKKFQFSKR